MLLMQTMNLIMIRDDDDDYNALCFMKVPSNCGQPIPQL